MPRSLRFGGSSGTERTRTGSRTERDRRASETRVENEWSWWRQRCIHRGECEQFWQPQRWQRKMLCVHDAGGKTAGANDRRYIQLSRLIIRFWKFYSGKSFIEYGFQSFYFGKKLVRAPWSRISFNDERIVFFINEFFYFPAPTPRSRPDSALRA